MDSDDVTADELSRLINACLLPGFSGAEPPAWVLEALDEGLAGVCLYGHNLVDAGVVRRISTALRARSPRALVAVDEEGGDVTRLEYLSGSSYPGNLALGVVDDVDLTAEVSGAIAADCAAAGVDLNFAPSVDVNVEAANPVIGVRSYGPDPARVAAHGAAAVRGMQARGVAACAKHFPGHGGTVTDSHLTLPVVDVDEQVLRGRDLVPFVAAIEAGAKAVMTVHAVFPALDDVAATLSRRVLTDLLRTELGFDGVVVTDALDMEAVRADHGIAGAGVKALAAGADLLLLGAQDGEQDCADVHAAVAEALRTGELTLARLREAASRVEALRSWTTQCRQDGPGDPVRPAGFPGAADTGAAGSEVGLRAARRAIRSAGVRPVRAGWTVVTMHAQTNQAVGNAAWSLAEPLGDHGDVRAAITVTADGPTAAQVVRDAGAGPLAVAVRDGYRTPWQRTWIADLLRLRPDAVVVGLGMAQDRDLTNGPVILAHGAGRANARAAAEVLTGDPAVSDQAAAAVRRAAAR